MSNYEILSTVLSLVALLVSGFTALKTFYPKSNINVFLRSRSILVKADSVPSIVVGFDISNTGAKPESIADVFLAISYMQSNNNQPQSSLRDYMQSNNSSNNFTFYPILSRSDYSTNTTYSTTDFENFDAFLVPGNSRFSKFIIFMPGVENFSPQAGEVEITAFFRVYGQGKWHKAIGKLNFPVKEEIAVNWKDPQGRSITSFSSELIEHRKKIMQDVFKINA